MAAAPRTGTAGLVLLLGLFLLLALVLLQPVMMSQRKSDFLSAVLLLLPSSAATAAVDLSWHAPAQTNYNNLTTALDGEGVYGFIFNTSDTPDSEYGTYNWCNMPHVRGAEYVKPADGFQLRYVELIHRHHKRTPYASNAFPVEPYHWDCDDQGLYYYGQHIPVDAGAGASALTYWAGYTSDINPFVPSGWIGSCQFPQITSGGLDDSFVHGADLYAVYHDLLGFLPDRDADWRSRVRYRVTTNQITSQVAGMVVSGMWGNATAVPLLVQASTVDSLEPAYTCTAGSALFNDIKSSQAWDDHLTAAADLYAELDAISGVASSDSGFHASFDHYYDNLSARQCHDKTLPCNSTTNACITQEQANTVYRLGQWEYSQIYRDAADSLAASVATYGVWIAELAAHLRAVVAGESDILWYHNVAHDGSVSRLLSVLQVDQMVWPGMGSEVVFELYEGPSNATSGGDFYVRVLFGGSTLQSSNPSLGLMDMLPVDTLLAYFDGLVGQNATLVKGQCDQR